MPRLAAVSSSKQRRVFHAGVNSVGIIQRGFQVPDAFELPGMLCSVVPLVRGEWFASFSRSIVHEFVAFAFGRAILAFYFLGGATRRVPSFAAIIGALNDLPKPAARLRGIDAIGINRRTFHVINFPPCKMRAANLPTFARAIGCQDERALPCADQYSDVTHGFSCFDLCLAAFINTHSQRLHELHLLTKSQSCRSHSA